MFYTQFRGKQINEGDLWIAEEEEEGLLPLFVVFG